MDELVREALREGRLTVAGGGPAALYTPWAAGFEKQYPGITAQVRGAFSNQLAAGINRQLDSGAPAVDVAILQTLQDFARWKAAGALLKTDIPAAGLLAPDWRDDDGRYLPIGVYGLGYGYDPARSPPGRSPGRPPGSPTRGGAAASSPPTRTKTTSRCISTACWRNGTAGRSSTSCWPAARSSSTATSAWPGPRRRNGSVVIRPHHQPRRR